MVSDCDGKRIYDTAPMHPPPYSHPDIATYSNLLAESFRRWTGQALVTGNNIAAALYEAPFPLVSHGTEADPVFRYANRAALTLWETDWISFTRMPSRLSAEPIGVIQDDRQQLLRAAIQKGWVGDYRGIRISARGRRFEISDTILWNVVDAQGRLHGQAARIGRVDYASGSL